MDNAKKWAAACLAAVLLAALAAAVPVGAEDEADKTKETTKQRDYSGKYLAEGVGNGDRPYKAMVEISRERDVYQVIWVLGPREAYMGVGLTEGDALCVGWSSGQVPGLIVYKPEGDKLVGRWAAPGARGRIFKETLTPVK